MNEFQTLVIYHYRNSTRHNFDDVCVQLKKENKTYAQYQKERYASLYDVKKHIEQYKRVVQMNSKYNVKYGDTFRIVGKNERG